MGNLTRDPQLRQIPSGTSVAELGLATNERYRSKSGEIAEKTCFVDIITWDKQAETCCRYLSKGSAVLVEGRLQLDQWKTDDGQNRSRLRVRADKINFLSKSSAAHDGQNRKESADSISASGETVSKNSGDNEKLPF
jgi:single-strand DNA-binding protein